MAEESLGNVLTADERADLAAYRADKAKEAKAATRDTHWVHLANGEVFTQRGSGGTHHKGVPVIGSYEIPEDYEGE